jgi:LCP family protein required for cell wall assembly
VRLLIAAVALTVAVGCIYGLIVFAKVNNAFKLGGQDVEGLERAGLNQPVNILVVGSDSRDGLTSKELQRIATTREDDGGRTDTMMVLHVSPSQKKAMMVSIPRDLKVTIDGRTEKINAAGVGGPDLLVRTVEANTGLTINHYVEIDMAGFLKAVRTLGGVDMCLDRPLKDRDANLDVKAGCQHFNATRAIAFVRSRKADGNNDYGRMARQQQFMRAVMKKITTGGTLLNPGKMIQLADDLGPHLRHDRDFSIKDAVAVIQRMGDLSADTLETRTLPAANQRACAVGCPSYEVATAEAFVLLEAIRRDAPAPPVGLTEGGKALQGVDLRGVDISVVNGGGVDGAARAAADSLRARGFRVTVAGNGEPTRGRATITYPKDRAAAARVLAAYLGDGVELVEAGPDHQGPGLVLTVGHGFRLPAAPPLESLK